MTETIRAPLPIRAAWGASHAGFITGIWWIALGDLSQDVSGTIAALPFALVYMLYAFFVRLPPARISEKDIQWSGAIYHYAIPWRDVLDIKVSDPVKVILSDGRKIRVPVVRSYTKFGFENPKRLPLRGAILMRDRIRGLPPDEVAGLPLDIRNVSKSAVFKTAGLCAAAFAAPMCALFI